MSSRSSLMFLSVNGTRLGDRGAEPGADRGDDDAREGDDAERADEAVLEEAPAQEGEREQLERDDRDRGDDRRVELGDQERQRVEDAAEEGAAARDHAPGH